MAKQIINIGLSPNDSTGEPIRVGGDKINQNFTELYDAKNGVGATFDNPAGNWGESPDTPLTTSIINLSLTNALNAGTACVYYSGNVLTKDSFTGGTIISFKNSGQVANELCFVWIIYDKGANVFHVNVSDGWTGATPPPTGETAPILTTTIVASGEVAPILTTVLASETAPILTTTLV